MAAWTAGAITATAGAAAAVETGSISGTVTLPAGAPAEWLAGVAVEITSVDGAYYDMVSVEPDGSYAFDSSADHDYFVRAQVDSYWDGAWEELVQPNLLSEYHDGTWFESEASTVTVAGAAVDNVDFELDMGQVLSGTVSVAEGASAEVLAGEVRIAAELDHWTGWHISSTYVSLEDGAYELVGMYPLNYTVYFSGSGFGETHTNVVAEYYDDATDWDSADRVNLAGGDVSGVDAVLEEGRSLSGIVSLPEGAPLEWLRGVRVEVLDASGNYVTYADVDSETGAYAAVGLPAQELAVQVSAGWYWNDEDEQVVPNLLSEYYLDAYDLDDATLVDLTAGAADQINVTLDYGRSISGTVSLETGAETSLAEQQVSVSASFYYGDDLGWDQAGEPVYVDAETGHYEITGLEPGNYRLTFGSSPAPEVAVAAMREHYDDASIFDQATDVDVSAESATGIDAELSMGSTLSGQLTLPDGVAAWWMEYVNVFLEGDGNDVYLDAYPAADGTWSVRGVPDGDYRLLFMVGDVNWESSGILSEYYDNALSYDDAQIITVSGSHITGLDASLELGNSITGAVTIPESVPDAALREIAVSVEGLGEDYFWGSTYVRADGTYEVAGLPDGDYNVYFEPNDYWDEDTEDYINPGLLGEYYDNTYSWDEAAVLTVDGTDVTGIDAHLDLGTSISGTVTLAEGADPSLLEQGVIAQAESADWDSAIWDSGYAEVDPETGDFTIAGLLPDQYVVQFVGMETWDEESDTYSTTNISPEYFDDVTGRDDATWVDVRDEAATGIDAELEEGGSISGTVTLDAGADPTLIAQGIDVAVETLQGTFYADSRVDPDTGTYTVSGLPHSDYTVYFSGGWNWETETETRTNVVSEFYDNAYTWEDATPVTVDGAASGIDISLAEGRTISGTVSVDSEGDPAALAGVWVYVEDMETGASEGASVNPETGAYSIAGLGSGSYIVAFQADGYWDSETDEYINSNLRSEYYDDAFSREDADAVVVGASDISGIDAELSSFQTGSLEVDLSYPGDAPYGGTMCLQVETASTGEWLDSQCIDTTIDLPLTFEGLPTDKAVVVSAMDDEGSWLASQYLGGSNLPGTGTEIALVADDTVSVTLAVQPVGTISGTVVYEDLAEVVGDGYADVLIYTERALGEWVQVACSECGGDVDPLASTVTDEAGAFTAVGLVAGDYKVGFRPDAAESAYIDGEIGAPTVFYGGEDLASATVVTLTAGGARTGIDAVLPLADGSDPDPTFAVSGSVSLPSGASSALLGSVQVKLYSGASVVASTSVSGAGSWSIGGVAAGDYKVKFDYTGSDGALIDEFYDDASTLAGASVVSVTDENVTGIDALLAVKAVDPKPEPEPTYGSSFPDVPKSNSFYKHVSWLSESGITSGYSNGSFGPTDPVTRGQMAAFLYKLAGSPAYTPPKVSPFADVSTSNVFYKHITWLADEGITSGVGDGSKFAPSSEVTRGQMAAFLYKLADSPSFKAPSKASFPDVPTSHTFFKHVEWLADTGITSGYGSGKFGPGDDVTRGQMAVFLYKYDRLDF
ncbi:hypothetical protein Dac01nite_05090 [Demequina activiva]|uniref:SLH domain-containing protein n=2 Tax=Demequina activiva TaxID=1582364 RepID=A0A919UFJ8_9MICO|nr:hypothetical protein Dac01nite_05090 [Demequina activiva]